MDERFPTRMTDADVGRIRYHTLPDRFAPPNQGERTRGFGPDSAE